MIWIALVFAGALLCNAIPHIAAGLRGEPFPTPFAKPHGVGHSAPLTNFLWGSLNLAAGLALLLWRLPAAGSAGWIAVAFGWLAIGVFCARHFGRVRAGR
jgi:hypothetical protein